MQRLLSTYILKEIFVPFVLAAAILTSTVLLGKTLKLVDLVVTHGVGAGTVLTFVVSVIPTFLIYIFPIAFLVAVLIACTRLSSDNEIMAMKSAGISLYALLRPVLLFAILAYALSLFVSLFGYPWGNFNVKKTLFEVARTNTISAIEEKTFYTRFKDVVLYVDNISAEEGRMKGIFISKTDDGESSVIFAKEGVFIPSPEDLSVSLVLEDGTVHRSRASGKEGDYDLAGFDRYSIGLDLKESLKGGKRAKSNRERYVGELMEVIREYELLGRKTDKHMVDLQKRFALPAAVFVFALLGIPLGIQKVRSARMAGFSISIFVVVVYYILFKTFEAIGESGAINPILAVWTPNILMGAAGLYFFRSAARDSEIKAIAWASRIAQYVGGRLKRYVGESGKA